MIAIKGMRLPENCFDCMINNLGLAITIYDAECPYSKRIITRDNHNAEEGRHPDCPMMEVKHEDA